MSLTRALSNAYSGLVSSSTRAGIASQNVANASTPGYARRTVTTSERVVAGQGNGVNTSQVERSQDTALSRLRRNADGSAAHAGLIANAFYTLNQAMGIPGETDGLFAAVENLESALNALIATPESEALQSALVANLNDLSRSINGLSHLSQSIRETADSNVAADVDTVNNALIGLQRINRDIGAYSEGTGNIAALEDERQRLLDQISEIIPIKDIPRGHGQLDVMTQSGIILLSGNQRAELTFQRAPTITNEARYDEGHPSLSGVFIGDIDITPGSGGRHAASGGTLAGHFHIRDSLATEFSDNLDAIAADLTQRLSDDSIDPTKLPGAAGTLTDNGAPFDPANIRGLSARLSINPAIDPNSGGEIYRIRDGLGATTPGAAGQIDILTRLRDALTNVTSTPTSSSINGSYSAAGFAAEFSSFIGEKTLRAETAQTSEVARQTILTDAELSQSAVDTDAELQDLLIIEQSYAANARVIQTIGDMVDQLLRL